MSTTATPADNQITAIVVVIIVLVILTAIGIYSLWSYGKDDILQNTVNMSNNVQEKRTKDETENHHVKTKRKRRRHRR